jgi:hypothetical protein
MVNPRRSVVLVGLPLAAAVVLAGCSRPAADARQASNLGTQVCVVNDSSQTPNVTFTLRDTGTDGPVPRGSQACGEGTMGGGKNDVEGRITFAAPMKNMTLWGNNPWIGAPGAGIRQDGGNSCAGYEGMSENSAVSWDDGVLRYVVKRLNDGQWKEFTITITDTQKPSADGQPAACKGGPGAAAAA